jgi:hypothetical protein
VDAEEPPHVGPKLLKMVETCNALALRISYHPWTKAILVAISASPPKWPPLGPYILKMVEIYNELVGLCFLHEHRR